MGTGRKDGKELLGGMGTGNRDSSVGRKRSRNKSGNNLRNGLNKSGRKQVGRYCTEIDSWLSSPTAVAVLCGARSTSTITKANTPAEILVDTKCTRYAKVTFCMHRWHAHDQTHIF